MLFIANLRKTFGNLSEGLNKIWIYNIFFVILHKFEKKLSVFRANNSKLIKY